MLQKKWLIKISRFFKFFNVSLLKSLGLQLCKVGRCGHTQLKIKIMFHTWKFLFASFISRAKCLMSQTLSILQCKSSILHITKLLNWKQFPRTQVKHTSTSNSQKVWSNHLLVKFCGFFWVALRPRRTI